jgi:hypothetical protein
VPSWPPPTAILPEKQKIRHCPTINTTGARTEDDEFAYRNIPYYNKFRSGHRTGEQADDERYNKIATLAKRGTNVELIRINARKRCKEKP